MKFPFPIALSLIGVGFGIASVPVMAQPSLPPDSAYVTAKDGHLVQNGQPVRFWGAIGNLPPGQRTVNGDPYYQQKECARRMKVVGFNMVRYWGVLNNDPNAKKGDLSSTDVNDFFIAECGKQGIAIWAPSIIGGADILEDDLELMAGLVPEAGAGATKAEWLEMARSVSSPRDWSNGRKVFNTHYLAVAWDPRMEAIVLDKAKAGANHVNLYNGLRNADNPTFAVWEFTNEQWWMLHMLGGDWIDTPPLLRRILLDRWHVWLTKKYGTQDKIIAAWGFLFPGEDLQKKTILLAPTSGPRPPAQLNDTNPAAISAFEGRETPVSREQCNAIRAGDVIEFFQDVIISHKKRAQVALKTWGKSCKLSPTVFDTGIGQSIHSYYMQSQADAVSYNSYMEGVWTEKLDRNSKRWPFWSGLDNPPQMGNNVPWLEHNRSLDKPYLGYETQMGGPSKYRAEWPVKIASLGSIQDWSAMCYHYWSFGQHDFSKPNPYDGGTIAFPGPGAYQYHFTWDEVEQAQMRAAGAVFRNSLLAPAQTPTIFRFGKPALRDPRSMDYAGDYGGSLMDMMLTTYYRGMRLVIDPNQPEFLKTEGKVHSFNSFEKTSPIKPTPGIEYDYNRGYLIFDAPGVAGYTGFFGQYGAPVIRFQNGVALKDIVHLDPPRMPYPSGAEKYTSFTLASEDGKPLTQCRKAVLALVASSFNTDTKIDQKPDGGYEMNWGKEPILVTRVGATLVAKPLAGMKYRMIDFSERVLAQGTVGRDGIVKIPANKPVWLTEFVR